MKRTSRLRLLGSVVPSSDDLRRYREIAGLLWKYGRADLVRLAELDDTIDPGRRDEAPDGAPAPEDLVADLEALGPTWIKLGQILSTQVGILPQPYHDALGRLQDHVEPMPFATVREVVAEELGAAVEDVFETFDPAPVAAASLGQVHAARLRNGRRVAVKVQRPGVRARIEGDFDALERITRLIDRRYDYELTGRLEQARKTLRRELDYLEEADNLRALADNLARFERIVVPRPVDACSTRRVLVMDYIEGRKVTDLGPIAVTEVDGPGLADEVFAAYLQQMLVDGIFHADPHPGNVLLTPEGRVALLDLGQVGRLTPRLREKLLQLFLATAEGRGEVAADVAIAIGARPPGFDGPRFREAIAETVLGSASASLERIRFGGVILEIARICGEHGMHVPPQLTIVGKALVHLDEVGRRLAPGFEPAAAVRRHAVSVVRGHVAERVSPLTALERAIRAKRLSEDLPARFDDLLDRLVDQRLAVRVDAIDEDRLIRGIQKIANRITVGLVLAALIIGAALLTRVETGWTVLGYPAVAFALFGAAALGAVGLVASILFGDE